VIYDTNIGKYVSKYCICTSYNVIKKNDALQHMYVRIQIVIHLCNTYTNVSM